MAEHFCLAVHGGAGLFLDDAEKSERGRAQLSALATALAAGIAKLRASESALSAVIAAVEVLEDAADFNAGRGSVLRSDGGVEMDASIMCGDSGRAGAVAGVRTLSHPVAAAGLLLEADAEVLLYGAAADARGAAAGLATRPREYFVTANRRTQWLRAQARGGVRLEYESSQLHGGRPTADPSGAGQTVGAVALDRHGHLAAATSTGGLTNAPSGRVGDSPIIGAGTWAGSICAISATGDGEKFVRAAFAHDIHARMEYGGQALHVAADAALSHVTALGGAGGCVAIDHLGRVAMPFTTPGMARACENHRGERLVALLPRAR